MPLARLATSLAGLRPTSHKAHAHYPHTSYASPSTDGNSQQRTLTPTELEPVTRQDTRPPTTETASTKAPELSLGPDGWESDPGSMYREKIPTRASESLFGTINSLLSAAAESQNDTVRETREAVLALNR